MPSECVAHRRRRFRRATPCSSRSRKIFGAWKAPKPEPPNRLRRRANPAAAFSGALAGKRADASLLGNLAITRRDPDWYRLVLANSIYGGAFHSRLVMNIREQKGYTYSPRSGVNALRQHGYFTVHAAVRNEVVAATLTEMFYEMDRMRSLPVTAEELESARSYLTGVFSLGVATQDGLLGQLSTVYLERLPEDYLETYRERIRALTAAGRSRRRAPPFRFRERANRGRRRPRANRRASRAIRRSHRVRRARATKSSDAGL